MIQRQSAQTAAKSARSRDFRPLCDALEPRMLLTTELGRGAAGAFLAVDGVANPHPFISPAEFRIDSSSFNLTPRQRVAIEFLAVDDAGRELQVGVGRRGANGRFTPLSGTQTLLGTKVVSLGRGSYGAAVIAPIGTRYHLFATLAGDINGDFEVDRFDRSLLNQGIIDATQGRLVRAPETPYGDRVRAQQMHFVQYNEQAFYTRRDLRLGVSLIYDNDSNLGSAGVRGTANPTGYWQYTVGGAAFTMKGVGGDYGYSDPAEWGYNYLTTYLAASGANTIRTYGLNDTTQLVTNTSQALALAKSLSTPSKPVMVLVGLYVPGVSTSDLETAIQSISKDANASHILSWCIGNETGPAYWSQIDTIAQYIKTLSSAPVCTAVPSVTVDALSSMNSAMPHLDFIGINTFYGQFDSTHVQDILLAQLDSTMATAKTTGAWTKPWAVTEYYSYDLPSPGFGDYPGMPSQTINGYQYFLELNSTDNAANYAASWSKYINSATAVGSLGGSALNWMPPHNSQVPGFWKDMFVYNGYWQIYINWYQQFGASRLQAVDAVGAVYGGSAPSVPAPQIVVTDGDPQGIVCDFKPTLTSVGRAVGLTEQLTVRATAISPDALTFDWYLIGGTTVTPSGGGITQPSTDPFAAYGPNAVTSILLGSTPGLTPLVAMEDAPTPLEAEAGTRQIGVFQFTLPAGTPTGNVYQLRVIIHDQHGGAATAAVALYT